MTPDELNDSRHHELESAWLYSRLADAETGKPARLFADLERESAKQAAHWEDQLRKDGVTPAPFVPGIRARLVATLAATLGPRRMLPVLSAMKVRGLAIYRGGTADVEGPAEESWHRAAAGGGALRAAVFGVNDGLVSNASLIIGVAGAEPEPRMIVVAGIAGLLAGGFSMAAGEYISVRTQRELLEYQIDLERRELATMPEEEIEELTLIYRAKGLSADQAATLARRIVSDPEQGLATLAREELGLDPSSLASPVVAALASFTSFAAGAALPLLPYLMTEGTPALQGAIAITLLALLSVGALMSLFTGRNPLWSAARMALLGTAAAALTWLIGRWLGVATS